ncbi:hypothetical protein ENUP19_0037G0034 [Entamoeba nuttalli]|uniref:Bromodomain containing protein n=2 Tax=Entamoeba nuttalli TaxID=412467 RepID=K2I004_ENTNP|nr:bromodomain containing protein [Entamoeba nuttalli P19]EKE42060.1 bromodomain containing protein [Entamoeba nuttalli P19]|eukprot:XP_008855605.1 bromodomain containing protein [Entamoeba nuttalli P19]
MEERSEKLIKGVSKEEEKKGQKKEREKKESKIEEGSSHRPMTRSMSGYEIEEKPVIKNEPLNSFEKELCMSVMKQLMKVSESEVFMEPVDPEIWNIPNYFDIIKTPMDLGTVIKKIKKNMYYSIDEFSNDVRLTFTNAMTFNPPGNYVHSYAEKLYKIFENYYRHCIRELNHHLKEANNLLQSKKKYSQKPLNRSEIHYLTQKMKNIPLECLNDVCEVLEIQKPIQPISELNIKLKDFPNSSLHHIYSIFKLNDKENQSASTSND